MSATIYSLLNDIFSNEDGLHYKWNDDGLENFNSISKILPKEVSSFISLSITIIPNQSMVIVPSRFGFTGKTPAIWRNHYNTKLTLDRNNVTVAFLNSKSTSGKLVIAGYILLHAGYILLKAPWTTHRVRYLQSICSKLPNTTPAFDILFHCQIPLEQEINHLAVWCGNNHVHPSSQV